MGFHGGLSSSNIKQVWKEGNHRLNVALHHASWGSMEDFLWMLFVLLSVNVCKAVVFVTSHKVRFVNHSNERHLRLQAVKGNPYRLIYGDMNVEMEVIKGAWSRPMNLSHHIIPRAIPFPHQMVQKYGRTCLTWAGTIPRLIVWDPELMKEVLNGNLGHFQKPPMNPHIKLLACGVASLEGDEWSKRQKTITPAFHLEKIKGMVPAFLASSVDLKKRWEELVGAEGSCELDVWPEFQNMTGDVISRTAFGSNFEEGKKIFRLQIDQSIPLIVGFVT